MEPLLGQYGFLTVFNISEFEARRRVREMNRDFGIMEFQFYDAMAGYSRPPRPDQKHWNNTLSKQVIQGQVVRAYVEEIDKMGGRSWLYVQAMATDPGDAEMQRGGFEPCAQHLVHGRALLDVVPLSARWAWRIASQWAGFAAFYGFSGIHWDTLGENHALHRSDIPGFLRAALPQMQRHGLAQTCNFIDGHGWDGSLVLGRRSAEEPNFVLEMETALGARAGSEDAAEIRFLVAHVWTAEVALPAAGPGQIVRRRVPLGGWPSKMQLAANGADAWDYRRITLERDGDVRVLLDSWRDGAAVDHRLGEGAAGGRASQVFDVPAGGGRLVRWAAHPELCLRVVMVEEHDGHYLRGGNVVLGRCRPSAAHPEVLFAVPAAGAAEGLIRWAAHPSRCLGVHDGGSIRLHRCPAAADPAGGAPAEAAFRVSSAGRIHWAAHPRRCLGVSGGGGGDARGWVGAPLRLRDCESNSSLRFRAVPQASVVAFPYWEVWESASEARFFHEVAPVAAGVFVCYPGLSAAHEDERQNVFAVGVEPIELLIKRWQKARRYGSAYLAVGDGNRYVQMEYFPASKELDNATKDEVIRRVFGWPEPRGAIYSGDVVYLRAHTGKHLEVGGSAVLAARTEHGPLQALVIQKKDGLPIRSGDIVYLRAHSGRNMDVEDTVVQARWAMEEGWQRLAIELAPGAAAAKAAAEEAGRNVPFATDVKLIHSGDAIFLRVHSGRFIDVLGQAVEAKWTQRGAWQALTIEKDASLLGKPFDCFFDLPLWFTAWTPRKKRFCCFTEKLGCAAPPPPAAPMPGADRGCTGNGGGWRGNWSDLRMWRCCSKLGEGCPEMPETRTTTTTATTTALDRSCAQLRHAGAAALMARLSQAQLDECCFEEGVGCTIGEPLAVPRPAQAAPPLAAQAVQAATRALTSTSTTAAASTTLTSTLTSTLWATTTTEAAATLRLPCDPLRRGGPPPHRWTAAERAQCCKELGVGCASVRTTTVASHNCQAGLWAWRIVWPPDKQRWCCRHQALGCSSTQGPRATTSATTTTTRTSTTTAVPLFDCNLGRRRWASAWTAAKRAFCCGGAGRGRCVLPAATPPPATPAPSPLLAATTSPSPPSPHFNCYAQLWSWRAMWSEAKKAYCCKSSSLGCEEPMNEPGVFDQGSKRSTAPSTSIAPSETFDCFKGSMVARAWPQAKRVWCCYQEGIGCLLPKEAADPSSTPPRYDCLAGLEHGSRSASVPAFGVALGAWSEQHKSWCCYHQQKGCKSVKDVITKFGTGPEAGAESDAGGGWSLAAHAPTPAKALAFVGLAAAAGFGARVLAVWQQARRRRGFEYLEDGLHAHCGAKALAGAGEAAGARIMELTPWEEG